MKPTVEINGAAITTTTPYGGSFDVLLAPGGRYVVRAHQCLFDPVNARITIREIQVPFPPPAQYELRLSNRTPGLAAITERKNLTNGGSAIARVPLGTVIATSFAKKKGTLEPPEVLASRYAVSTRNVSPKPIEPTIFESDVLLRFGEDTLQHEVTWQAVHLGSTTITILPFVSGVAPASPFCHSFPASRRQS